MSDRLIILNSNAAKALEPYASLAAVQAFGNPIQIPDPVTGVIFEKSQAEDIVLNIEDPANPFFIGPASWLGSNPAGLVTLINILLSQLATPMQASLTAMATQIADQEIRLAALEDA